MKAQLNTEAAIPFSLWGGIFAAMLCVGLLWLAGPYSEGIQFAPDQGTAWYYWKLTDPTLASRLSAWAGYLGHQISMWAIIHYAITHKDGYSKRLRWLNWLAIAVNLLFIAIHVLQTKVYYDALAQDTSIYSSFGSVTLMLWVILIMENRRRGMFLGKSLPVLNQLGDTLKRYHGYYISWAITYTFWYHPIEITSGHLIGFFYIFLLMLQGSLFLTRFHTNRWWTVTLETFFAIHGAIVAYFVSQGGLSSALVFFMGGVGVFIVTQIYGVPLQVWQRRLLIGLGLLGFIAFALYYDDRPVRIAQMVFLLYAGVLSFALILWLLMKSVLWLRRDSSA